jgi:cytochrome c-type biogenesis protein CcmE
VTPTRRRRLALVGLLLTASAVAALLISLALEQNMTYLHTPSEVHEGKVPIDGNFRLGGLVVAGSVVRVPGELDVRFTVTDEVHEYPVRFGGILPDLFREGQSVIARGRLSGDEFVAEEVLAKHDETYVPPEVADKMAEAKARGEAAAHGTARAVAGEPANGEAPANSTPAAYSP